MGGCHRESAKLELLGFSHFFRLGPGCPRWLCVMRGHCLASFSRCVTQMGPPGTANRRNRPSKASQQLSSNQAATELLSWNLVADELPTQSELRCTTHRPLKTRSACCGQGRGETNVKTVRRGSSVKELPGEATLQTLPSSFERSESRK